MNASPTCATKSRAKASHRHRANAEKNPQLHPEQPVQADSMQESFGCSCCPFVAASSRTRPDSLIKLFIDHRVKWCGCRRFSSCRKRTARATFLSVYHCLYPLDNVIPSSAVRRAVRMQRNLFRVFHRVIRHLTETAIPQLEGVIWMRTSTASKCAPGTGGAGQDPTLGLSYCQIGAISRIAIAALA